MTTNTSVEIDVKTLIVKLLNVQTSAISLEAVCDIVAEVEREANPVQLFSFPQARQYTIAAPKARYVAYDLNGKKVHARDYFRSIVNAVAGDEVTVEVQAGLSAAGVQKNVNSLLESTPSDQYKDFKTKRTSAGVLVKFS